MRGSSRDECGVKLVILKSMEYVLLFYGSMGTLTGEQM